MKQKNIKWHETCKCECRLGAIVCNDKKNIWVMINAYVNIRN